MTRNEKIVKAVSGIYDWIACQTPQEFTCRECGKCCRFDAYDHRLFVSSPELVYFAHHIGPEGLKPMQNGICPYNADGKCTVHPHRFAACRIFFCNDDQDFQSVISEAVLASFKDICIEFDLPYQYLDLPKALQLLQENKIAIC